MSFLLTGGRTPRVTSAKKTLPTNPLLVAIDGPAGAGKSTVAALLAERLGIPYLDTGAMYRAVALLAVRDGLSRPLGEANAERVIELVESHAIEIQPEPGGTRVLVDEEDVSSLIRTPEISLMASDVSALAGVRRALVEKQRRLGHEKGGVMEGRDIGTVVLPDAPVKIFLTARAGERALRRFRDLGEEAGETTLEDIRSQQQQRDLQDTSRAESPLQVARGSVVVDTTGMSVEEVVERLLAEVEAKVGTPLDSQGRNS